MPDSLGYGKMALDETIVIDNLSVMSSEQLGKTLNMLVNGIGQRS